MKDMQYKNRPLGVKNAGTQNPEKVKELRAPLKTP